MTRSLSFVNKEGQERRLKGGVEKEIVEQCRKKCRRKREALGVKTVSPPRLFYFIPLNEMEYSL